MSIFTEYSRPPGRTVLVAEVLFRIAIFYSVATLILGLSWLGEAPWVAACDGQLGMMLAQDGTLFVLTSIWFGALAMFFRERPHGLSLPTEAAQFLLFLQFAIFAGAMWPPM